MTDPFVAIAIVGTGVIGASCGVGGDPTGMELASAIEELAVDVIPHDFRNADTRRARVTLIEAGPRLLPPFHPSSSRKALR